ncbi:MAG: UDP-N-acetylmuramate dehydrogenase [Anaerolineales bacterium]
MNFEPYHYQISDLRQLELHFGDRLRADVVLAPYTASRLGGPADVFLDVESVQDLALAAKLLWEQGVPFIVLGGGSNVLVSDSGVRGVVLHNRARRVYFNEEEAPPTVWGESGANFGLIARQAAARGLSGLEWAAGIPGTLGGAVIGNAGAHGGDMAGNLLMADILQQDPSVPDHVPESRSWSVERLGYEYRSSILKRKSRQVVVLAAVLRLQHGDTQAIQARMAEYLEFRRRTQPPGASMGSMFKNPATDYAGRLVDAAGLKGTRVGDAQISDMHANFFLNLGQASAADVYELIRRAREKVAEIFGVYLELEIELIGDWPEVGA